ncbi:ABC transporter permease subunit [Methylobacterium sp. NEAU 140]|uniref:ABC transporter permease n=1 Tax=Methylobacterium sp. NEAU 140 TaxID=3064945 RepID=UPI002734FE80|nr:ABC transporter permease subunit [Methylobacterium sp. NEAU 140]MDP4023966.1 ABC transporter permease subunit [Methylobacterium sp. NEAU 140]
MSRAGLIRTGVIVAALAALEAACRTGLIDRFSLSPPSEMAISAARILASGEYTRDILATFATVAAAAALSIVAGFGLGVVLYRFPRLKRAADPFLASYYAVPSFIFYPLFIVLFGLNRWPLVAVAFVFAVVAMAIASVDGFLSVRPILLRTAASLRLTRAQTLRHVILPAAAPYLFTGVKLTVVYAFIGVVAGEFILSGSGLGYRIAFAYQSFETATMYGLMLILLTAVVSVNMLLWARERRLHARLTR